MSCIREKVKIQRAGLKEMKAKQKAAQLLNGPIMRKRSVLSKPTPADKVLNAIRQGARTQDEIRWKTRLDKDVIGDALAELMLDREEVVSESNEDRRYYFIRTTNEQLERKDCVLSLSCFGPVIRDERVA
jgi:hypothetical protein